MSHPDIRICFIGDSFVNGTGDPEFLGWTGRVCASAAIAGHAITHYNLGIRRNTSADITARWETECRNRLVGEFEGRVVFSFGVNDTVFENGALRVSGEETLRHARQILATARQHYPCLWVGPPPVADAAHNERLRQLCPQFQEVAVELGVPYLPILAPLLQSEIWMHEVTVGDGAHPGAAGYQELAALVGSWAMWWF